MAPRLRKQTSERGFTLIELMIVVLIIGVLSASLASYIRALNVARLFQSGVRGETELLQNLSTHWRRDIREAVGAEITAAASGAGQTLTLTASQDRRIAYVWAGKGGDLVREDLSRRKAVTPVLIVGHGLKTVRFLVTPDTGSTRVEAQVGFGGRGAKSLSAVEWTRGW